MDDGESRTHALVRLAMQSRANLCVTPIQDLLELTNGKGRMNTPSVPYGNWTYRMKFKYDTQDLKNKIVSLTVDSKRA
jgi:4-alpha-glucanotransferase